MKHDSSLSRLPLRSTESAAIRIFTVCGDTMFRRGVAAVLAEEPAFHWVGEAAEGMQALATAPAQAPDVTLIDAELPDMDGIGLLQALRTTLPRTRFAMLFSQLDADDVRAAVAAGAACVLSKNTEQGEMIAALTAVHRGVWAHSPAVTQALTAPRSAAVPQAKLTPRERDLLALMAQGMTNGDIASRLSIAMPTVKFHVGHIMSKLGVENRTAAVLAALRHKLVDLNASAGAMVPSTAD